MTKHTRKPISRKTRFQIFKRDEFTCRYCGRNGKGVVLHVDHIEPVVKGGTNHPDNLATACQWCNSGKGTHDAIPPNHESNKERAVFYCTTRDLLKIIRTLEWMDFFKALQKDQGNSSSVDHVENAIIELSKQEQSYMKEIEEYLSNRGVQ